MNYGFDEWRRGRGGAFIGNPSLSQYMSSGSAPFLGSGGPNNPMKIGDVDFDNKNDIMDVINKARAEFQGYSTEVDTTITSDGSIWRTYGTTGTVNTSAIEDVHGISLKGAYSYHNHLAAETNYSLSGEDIGYFLQRQMQYMEASDNLYRYGIERTKSTTIVTYETAYNEFKNKTYEIGFNNRDNPTYDDKKYMYHDVNERLSILYGFKYWRISF